MDIFLSYSRSCEKLASKIEDIILQEPAFRVIRDIHSVDTGDDIKCFMDSIRTSICSIVIINQNYLYSENCLYELMSLSKERDFTSRIIPIEITETDFFSKDTQKKVVEYWKHHYEDSLPFEPKELRYTLGLVSNLKCIGCDLADINSMDACSQAVLQAVFKHAFQRERRIMPSMSHSIPLAEKRILCIDFGTSYTLGSVMGADGNLYMIRDGFGKVTFPSIIGLFTDGSYAVGNFISARGYNSDMHIIREIKREISKNNYCTYGSHKFSAKFLVAMIFHSIKQNAEEFIGVSFSECLLSVPVDFRFREIHLMESAAEIAGLSVIRTIQESSLAALLIASHVDERERCYSLNVDLGGGTLDISGADYEDGVCEILFSFGDRELGSIDYDYAIAAYIEEQLKKEYNIFPIYPDSSLHIDILTRAEQVKMDLGVSEQAVFSLDIPNQSGDVMVYTYKITRSLYDDITSSLTQRMKDALIQSKKLMRENVEHFSDFRIYLTGQGSKLFSIKRLIQEIFPENPILDCYQESAVCQGLAQQSGIFNQTVDNLLLLDNLHIYLDILCERYDEDEDILYIGAENHNFYRLIDSRYDDYRFYGYTIPYGEDFLFAFTDPPQNGLYEIKLYDYSPTNDLHTLIFSQVIPAAQISTTIHVLSVIFNADSKLCVEIRTEEEFYQHQKDLRNQYVFHRAKNRIEN